jgi:hypothetical protein
MEGDHLLQGQAGECLVFCLQSAAEADCRFQEGLLPEERDSSEEDNIPAVVRSCAVRNVRSFLSVEEAGEVSIDIVEHVQFSSELDIHSLVIGVASSIG